MKISAQSNAQKVAPSIAQNRTRVAEAPRAMVVAVKDRRASPGLLNICGLSVVSERSRQ